MREREREREKEREKEQGRERDSWCLEDAKNRVHHRIHGRPHMTASGLLLGQLCKL